MIQHQNSFTESEALAILEMVSTLCAENYRVEIFHGAIDNERKVQYCVIICRGDSVVSTGDSFLLVEAMTDAYQMVPDAVTER